MAADKQGDGKFFKILAIDGGGIRGIIPAAVLSKVEEHARKKHGDDSIKIGECFDLVAGTSTGGILTGLFLVPDDEGRARFGAEDGLDLYMRNGGEIFERSVWHRIASADGLLDEKYSSKPLESLLQKYVGDTELKDLIRPCLITAYATREYRPYFFTQHTAAAKAADNFPLWEVGRSTSAAPTFFEAAMPDNLDSIPNPTPMIDGGVFANNPTACAFAEAIKILGDESEIREIVILSVGTGRSPKSITFSECKDWGVVGWLKPLVEILMEGVAQTVDYQLKTIYSALGIRDQYLRIDALFGDHAKGLDIQGLEHDMDNASRGNMQRLEMFGRRLADLHEADIAKFVEAYL